MWVIAVCSKTEHIMYKKNNPNNDFGYKYTQDFISIYRKPWLTGHYVESYNGLGSA